MKCIVIYFSQTGNTEKIAHAIHKGMEQAAGSCDIVTLKDADPRGLEQYDLIGLGMPVFDFVEPENVDIFIESMRFVGGRHAFVFATHGTNYKPLYPSIWPRLQKRGLVVIGAEDWYGSVYTTRMPRPYHTDGHPDEIDIKEAEEFGREMVKRSKRISAGETDLIPPEPDYIPPYPDIDDDNNPEPDKRFETMVHYVKERCNYPRCRLCMDNCPMGGIDLTVDRPIVFDPCIKCMFCIELCPTGALDSEAYDTYVAPRLAADLRGLLIQHLPEEEARGHYRRLVPLEEVGTDLPMFRAYTHPYWILGKGPGKRRSSPDKENK